MRFFLRLKVKLLRLFYKFEQLTPESKQCFLEANQLARNQNCEWINSLHLLIAILQTERVHDNFDPDRRMYADAIEQLNANAMMHKEGLKQALTNAIVFARQVNCVEITPLHLLLGIARTEDLAASTLIQKHDLDLSLVEALLNADLS